ncbi:MAG: hypothetical protein LBN01_04485 [Endomicrobium sp.]|nr:hypothetical protein [Endomicrobium sp.]
MSNEYFQDRVNSDYKAEIKEIAKEISEEEIEFTILSETLLEERPKTTINIKKHIKISKKN